MSKIIFKNIPGYKDRLAGSDGHIYSTFNGRMLKLKVSFDGQRKYLHVHATPAGSKQRKNVNVHRLICIAFHGLPENHKELSVSHLDGNRLNNRPENLKWETMKDNSARKYEHGTDDNGVKNSRAKINKETLDAIRKDLSDGILTHEKIGEKYNLNRVFITKINRGHRYKNS